MFFDDCLINSEKTTAQILATEYRAVKCLATALTNK